MFYRLILLMPITFISLFMNTAAHADNGKTISAQKTYSAIGEFTAVYAEKGPQLSLTEVQKSYAQGLFSASDSSVLSLGNGSPAHWITFTINNPTQNDLLRRLIIENSWLDLIDLYIINNGKLINQQRVGDQFPFSTRLINHRFFAFDHHYPSGSTQIFIRIETPDPMIVPIFFGSLSDSAAQDLIHGYSYGLIYGIVIALLLYNFILYFNIKRERYLYYVIYLSMFLVNNIGYTGHGFWLFWSDNTWWQHWTNPVCTMLYSVTGIIFALSFLQTRSLFPRAFSLISTTCIALTIMLGIFILLDMQAESVILAVTFVIFFSVSTLSLALLSLNSGKREVKYFLFASVATLFGASVTAMAVLGIIPYSELRFRAVEIGIVIDVILLSIALAEQFRLLQQDKLQAEQLSRIDPLTQLYNRRAFNEAAALIWHNVERYQKNLSIMVLDIDHFKVINDQYGHGTGDQALKSIANTLREMVRDGDILARWGGEEFTILLPETNLIQALTLAERLRETIAKLHILVGKTELSFTVSIGVAQKEMEMSNIENLFNQADIFMYQAKQAGRNQVYGIY